ncbi:MAG TPA: NAD(P)H-dependent oxidoreductase subunit E, partial [Tissierellaceae bacterium]
MAINSAKELESLRDDYKKALNRQYKKVIICGGTGCVAGGAFDIYDELVSMVKEKGLLVDIDIEKEDEGIGIKKSGCHGFCEAGPLVRIEPEGYLYIKVKKEDCEEIVEKTLMNNEPIERLMYKEEGKTYQVQEEIPFYKGQTRMVLEHCGHLDSEAIGEYLVYDGYKALEKVLTEMTPKEVCQEIKDANLRGRGGGGFPAGIKWEQVLGYESDKKYIICNGDEGDPGAFMDRSIMEGDPHAV